MPTFEVEMGGKTYQVQAPNVEAAVNGIASMGRRPVYSGSVLPMTKYSDGTVDKFDTDAGFIGSLKRTATLPGEVYRGEVDPMSDEGIARSVEMGLVTLPMNPGVRSGDFPVPGMKRGRHALPEKAPTAQALKQAGSRGYDQVRDMGVHYRPDAVTGLASRLRMDLERDGILPNLAPKAYKILDDLQNAPSGPGVTAPLSGIEAARRGLRNAAKDFTNPTEQLAAERIIRGLDGFVEVDGPATAVAGPAAAASKVSKEARANYAAGKRSDRLTGIKDAADLRSAAANSGQNLDNAIRQRAVSVLLDPKKRAGFSKAEIALIERVAKGNVGRNTIRAVGNLLGGGGGLGAVVSGAAGGVAGGAIGGPAGVAIGVGAPLLGMGAKKTANSMTSRALNKVDEATRKRSPLYHSMPKEPVIPRIPNTMSRTPVLQGNPNVITDEQYREYLRRGGA